MTQEHKQDIPQELSLSTFLVQQREGCDLDLEEVSSRTDIPVERLEKLDKDATNITLFEATEIASLYGCGVSELASILWNEKAESTLGEIRENWSKGKYIRIYPPRENLTLSDHKSYLKALKSLNGIE